MPQINKNHTKNNRRNVKNVNRQRSDNILTKLSNEISLSCKHATFFSYVSTTSFLVVGERSIDLVLVNMSKIPTWKLGVSLNAAHGIGNFCSRLMIPLSASKMNLVLAVWWRAAAWRTVCENKLEPCLYRRTRTS